MFDLGQLDLKPCPPGRMRLPSGKLAGIIPNFLKMSREK
jgi:hypothetical protein